MKILEQIKTLLLKSKKDFSILMALSTPLFVYLFYDIVVSFFFNKFILISMLISLTVTFVGNNVIWAILCSFLSKMKYIIYFISYVFLLIDVYCISLYKNQFNEPLAITLLNTNLQETLEYLSINLNIEKVLYFILINIVVFVLYKSFSFLLKQDWKFKIVTSTRLGVLILTTIIVNYIYMFQSVPINHFLSLSSYLGGQMLSNIREREWQKENPIIIEENKSTIPYVVLILGESTSRTHLHLYGHETPNTPLLEEKIKNNELIAYTNTISGDTYTVEAVAELFSFYNSKSNTGFYQNHNIIDILKKAGYKTFWLSNQAKTGEFSYTQYGLAEKCDYMQFTSNNGDKKQIKVALYDEELFPIIDDVLENKVSKDKNFIVINLMGTHQAYSQRYPKEYNKFIRNEDNEKEYNLHNYDNAVLYNDYVVSTIMDKFKDKNALVIYLSDHGEDVSEPNIEQDGHYPNGTEHQKLIPMMFWGSDSFRKQYVDKWKDIESKKDDFLSTEDFIYPFLNLMEIKTKEIKEKEEQ